MLNRRRRMSSLWYLTGALPMSWLLVIGSNVLWSVNSLKLSSQTKYQENFSQVKTPARHFFSICAYLVSAFVIVKNNWQYVTVRRPSVERLLHEVHNYLRRHSPQWDSWWHRKSNQESLSSFISPNAFCCDGPHSLAILDFRRSVVGFIVVDKTDNNRSRYLIIPMTLRISFIFVGAVGQSVRSMLFDHNCLFSLSPDSRILSSGTCIFKRVLCFWWAFHKTICHQWWPLCLRVHGVGLTSHVGKSSALTVSQT